MHLMDILLEMATLTGLCAAMIIGGVMLAWAFNYVGQLDPPPDSEARTRAGTIIAGIIIFPMLGIAAAVYLASRLVWLAQRKPVKQDDTD